MRKQTVIAAALALGLVLAGLGLLRPATAGAAVSSASSPSGNAAQTELRGGLSISGAWALYPMVLKWAEEFKKVHPAVTVDVQAGGAGKGIADALAGSVDAGMVSRGINPAEVEKGALAVAVAKDAVVPTLNGGHPFLAEIMKRGVKKEEFFGIWVGGTIKTWDALLGPKAKAPIHVFTRSDACGAAETWAAYLGKRQEDLGGVGVYGDPGVAEAVRRDPLAVGYNNVNFAYDPKTRRPVAGIAVCPIDLNGNGALDPEENFYRTRDDLLKAIAANIYPSPPARELYLVLKGKPRSPLLAEFMRWILTGGQAFVAGSGYLPLDPARLAEGLKALGVAETRK